MEKVKLNRHFISDIFFYQEGPGVRKWQFKDSGVKLINVGNINNGKIDLSSTKINISEEEAYGKYSHFLIDEGDLLIACSGIVVENFHNKIAFIKKEHLPLCLNTSTMRFKELPEKKGDLNFLKYFLQTNDFKSQLRKLITGSAQLNFGPSHIRKIEIPLPNLATQHRIAAILDQADAIIQNNRAIVQKYDALTQSLFLDMFGDPVKNEKGWKVKSLGDITNLITDGKHGNCNDEKDSGYYFISAKDVKNNLINYTDAREIPKIEFEEVDKRTNLQPGDLVMINTGATIGRMAIAKDIPETRKTTFQKSVAVIKVKNDIISSFYLQYVLELGIKTFANMGSGSAIKNLLLSEMRRFKIILPNLELQNKFAERVSVIEVQKQQAQLELAKSEELFQSLLQKAFKGELN